MTYLQFTSSLYGPEKEHIQGTGESRSASTSFIRHPTVIEVRSPNTGSFEISMIRKCSLSDLLSLLDFVPKAMGAIGYFKQKE